MKRVGITAAALAVGMLAPPAQATTTQTGLLTSATATNHSESGPGSGSAGTSVLGFVTLGHASADGGSSSWTVLQVGDRVILQRTADGWAGEAQQAGPVIDTLNGTLPCTSANGETTCVSVARSSAGGGRATGYGVLLVINREQGGLQVLVLDSSTSHNRSSKVPCWSSRSAIAVVGVTQADGTQTVVPVDQSRAEDCQR